MDYIFNCEKTCAYLSVVGNFFRPFTMDNLRYILEQKYFNRGGEKYRMEQIASDIINLLNAHKNNYFDVTGFAKDFYLAAFLTQDKKEYFYKELKERNFFQQLDTFLYSNNFSICSWTIYTIGKFSNNENVGYLEKAYETNFSLTNPMLSYRCLNELSWLNSKKLDQYLADLELDKSTTSKLILLYYWETSSDKSKFKELLTNEELISFIAPNQTLVDTEEEICGRLFAFENHISEQYNMTDRNIIDKNEFKNTATNYFKTYLRLVDTQADKDHQDFLKLFGED